MVHNTQVSHKIQVGSDLIGQFQMFHKYFKKKKRLFLVDSNHSRRNRFKLFASN